jgi:hypothetical protein
MLQRLVTFDPSTFSSYLVEHRLLHMGVPRETATCIFGLCKKLPDEQVWTSQGHAMPLLDTFVGSADPKTQVLKPSLPVMQCLCHANVAGQGGGEWHPLRHIRGVDVRMLMSAELDDMTCRHNDTYYHRHVKSTPRANCMRITSCGDLVGACRRLRLKTGHAIIIQSKSIP